MEKRTGEEVAEILADFVNGLNSENKAEFVEKLTKRTHRTLQQQVFGLFVASIFSWSETEENYFDLRNEYTIKTSKELAEVIAFTGVPLI